MKARELDQLIKEHFDPIMASEVRLFINEHLRGFNNGCDCCSTLTVSEALGYSTCPQCEGLGKVADTTKPTDKTNAYGGTIYEKKTCPRCSGDGDIYDPEGRVYRCEECYQWTDNPNCCKGE